MRKLIAAIVAVHCLSTAVSAAMFVIDNPADTIRNPADKMSNPATEVKDPASNIYNPSSRVNNPNPLSPPTKAVSEPKTEASTAPAPAKQPTAAPAQSKPAISNLAIPQKQYHFKTSGAYLAAAKKSFVKEDYRELLSITEDALRRINAGTLKASEKSRQTLARYKAFGSRQLGKQID
jgi:hypothetical protein